MVRLPTTSPARHPQNPRRLARRIVPQNPAGFVRGSFGFRLHHRLALSQNPAGLPGGSFGFRLHHRLGILGCSPARPADGSASDQATPARPLPKSRRLARRDRSASDYITGSPSPEPAGSPGGSFGFRLHHRLALSQNPAGRLGGSFQVNPAGSAPGDRFSASAGLPGGSFGFRLHHRSAVFPELAGSPGGWFGFRLHHRLGIPADPPPARPADRSCKSRRLASADRSASDYITGSPSPRIPPACPADRSASDYITGSASLKSRRLARRDGSGFRLHHRLAHRTCSPRGLGTVDQPGRTSLQWPALA